MPSPPRRDCQGLKVNQACPDCNNSILRLSSSGDDHPQPRDALSDVAPSGQMFELSCIGPFPDVIAESCRRLAEMWEDKHVRLLARENQRCMREIERLRHAVVELGGSESLLQECSLEPSDRTETCHNSKSRDFVVARQPEAGWIERAGPRRPQLPTREVNGFDAGLQQESAEIHQGSLEVALPALRAGWVSEEMCGSLRSMSNRSRDSARDSARGSMRGSATSSCFSHSRKTTSRRGVTSRQSTMGLSNHKSHEILIERVEREGRDREVLQIQRKLMCLDTADTSEICPKQIHDLLSSGPRPYTMEEVVDVMTAFAKVVPVSAGRNGANLLFGPFADVVITPENEDENLEMREQFGSDLFEFVLLLRGTIFVQNTGGLLEELTNVKAHHLSKKTTMDWYEIADLVVGFMILANSICLGISTDHGKSWLGWEVLEVVFVAFFVCEAVVRVAYVGPRLFFTGPGWKWNIVDLLIVALAFADLILVWFQIGTLSTVRMARLLRLLRLLRLCRLRSFEGLAKMTHRLFAGLRTLFWACMILLLLVYVAGVFMTQTVGRNEDMEQYIDGRTEMFASVDKSMFTVFRCFTGDCNNALGRPIVMQLQQVYGWRFGLPFSLGIIGVTFGIFNLIMSIFVESTMQASKFNDGNVSKIRHMEAVRVAKKTRDLVIKFYYAQLSDSDKEKMKPVSEIDVIDLQDADITMTRELFEHLLQDPAVQQLMDDLDLGQNERTDLFEVLDADGNGRLQIEELVSGLLRLRGEARKSDVVASRLALRALQQNFKEFEMDVLRSLQDVLDSQRVFNEQILGVSDEVGHDAEETAQDPPVSRSPSQTSHHHAEAAAGNFRLAGAGLTEQKMEL